MSLQSLFFVFGFLPLFLFTYYCIKDSLKNLLIVAGSCTLREEIANLKSSMTERIEKIHHHSLYEIISSLLKKIHINFRENILKITFRTKLIGFSQQLLQFIIKGENHTKILSIIGMNLSRNDSL